VPQKCIALLTVCFGGGVIGRGWHCTNTWILCVLFYYLCIAVLYTVVAGFLARSQYPEGPATGHLGTGFSWFPCVYKWMLRWFPRLQVATACFSCSPPNLNFLDPYFIFMYTHYNHCHRATVHLQFIIIIIITTTTTEHILADWLTYLRTYLLT